MELDAAERNPECLGDGLVRRASGQQTEDFGLSSREGQVLENVLDPKGVWLPL